MDLISDLKNEHQQILQLFNEIDQTVSLEGKKKLVATLMELMTAHLKNEDEQVHRPIIASDNEKMHILGVTLSEMVVDHIGNFTEVMSRIKACPDVMDEQLIKDYMDIRDKIINRIAVEENLLFPAYEELVQAK